MARRSDFTDAEWETMQTGIRGAGLLVSGSDRGVLSTLREGRAFATKLDRAGQRSASQLVSELVKTMRIRLSGSGADRERETLDALRESIAVLEAKAPDEVEAYRAFVLEVAESVAGAAPDAGRLERLALDLVGTPPSSSGGEEAVLDRIRAALGGRRLT